MVLYTCDRCGYSTTIKSHLKKHLNRKKTCPSKNCNISINNLKKKYGFHDSLTSERGNICPFCNKYFSRRDNLKRHLEKCVPKNKSAALSHNSLYQKIEKLIDTLNQSPKVQHHHYTNIEHQTNIINIRGYGEENNDYITDHIKTLLLKQPGVMIQKLITYKHFNQDHPENRNIKPLLHTNPLESQNDNTNFAIQTFNSDNNDWESQDPDEVIKNLVTKNFNNLENHYGTTKGQGLNEQQKKRLEQFNKKFILDEEVRNIIEKDTKMIIEHSKNS